MSAPASSPPTASPHDRLVTAIFIAVVFHLLILLGVGFSASSQKSREASSLEVILVHDPISEAQQNEQADYLAEVNQHGGGTAADVRRAEAPGAARSGSGDGSGGESESAARSEASAQAASEAGSCCGERRRISP